MKSYADALRFTWDSKDKQEVIGGIKKLGLSSRKYAKGKSVRVSGDVWNIVRFLRV